MLQLDSVQRVKISLRRLAPTSLAELDRVALMNRVDAKYVLRDALLPDLIEDVASAYRALEVDGVRCAPYATLYFDSPDAACYHEHHNGKGRRYKYRMRSYLSSQLSFFEVKQRTNKGRTVKSRVPIAEITSALDDRLMGFVGATTGDLPPLESAVWTRFSRITLAGIDVPERVTIDVDLTFAFGRQRARLPGVAVVEVKQDRNWRDSAIRRALRARRIPPLRVSKYCLGRALLDPSLKRNRFKAKLLALQHLLDDER